MRFDLGERERIRHEFAELDNKTNFKVLSEQFDREVCCGFHDFPHKYFVVWERIHQPVDLSGMMEIRVDAVE